MVISMNMNNIFVQIPRGDTDDMFCASHQGQVIGIPDQMITLTGCGGNDIMPTQQSPSKTPCDIDNIHNTAFDTDDMFCAAHI
jgi:hypothetical protein